MVLILDKGSYQQEVFQTTAKLRCFIDAILVYNYHEE